MIKNLNKKRKNITINIKEDNSFQILKLAIDNIKEKYHISSNEILSLIEEKPISKEILIPVSIFEVNNLSALEAICKYLKEELELGYSKIASLLNRNSRTIWATYNNAVKKKRERLKVKDSKFFVPISVFTDRRVSVLGAIVGHLKVNFNLRYSEIAILLNRDERNIWTVYNRYKNKK